MDLRTCVAFHLAGRRAAPDLPPFDPQALRPALFARYHDLTALRYDFPLVLARSDAPEGCIRSLSGVFDDLRSELSADPEPDRTAAHLRRLERAIRGLAAQGRGGLLSELWREAAGGLRAGGDATLEESLDRASTALAIDGEVVDLDRALPGRVLEHAWRVVHEGKAARFGAEIGLLVAKLEDILRSDFARSDAGRTPASLAAAFGSPHEDAFDYDALSRLLTASGPGATLPEGRRARIRRLLATLRAQRFYTLSLDAHPNAAGRAERPPEGYGFVFESVRQARDAYHERLPHLLEVARAIGMADLETRGDYDESRHDAFFEQLGVADLGRRDLDRFPDYLVIASADQMTPADDATLMELLSTGLPIKALVRTDDLTAGPAGAAAPGAGVGVRQRQLSTAAMGLNRVYVLQSTASEIHRDRGRLLKGLRYAGPAVFSVYSGDDGTRRGLPPYLRAAAALEARAFPSIVYDPSAGPDWASRCNLEGNPQVERDWPVHPLDHEDRDHQRRCEDVAFTLVDFLACEPRHAAHLAPVPASMDASGLEPVSAFLVGAPEGPPARAPFVWVVDGGNALARAVVDAKLVSEARRCLEMWRSLQELGGIHNSHAARVLARERREAEARALAAVPVGASAPAPEAPVAAAAAEIAAPERAGPTASPERDPAEAWIETPRCSSCNECVQLNRRMFAYNANQQAYIADPDAGTFRQLVEAAESCQVAIIHPGRPRNPDEPGLEELLERAAAFD